MKLIQKIFSKNRENSELKGRDKFDNYLDSNLGRRYRDQVRVLCSENRKTKDLAKIGAVTGAISGIPIEYLTTDKLRPTKKDLVRSSLLGSGLSAGLMVAIPKVMPKISPDYRNRCKRRLDLLDVHDGKMSKEDFIKKYYKK